jgi:hypothetical protein
MMQKNCPENEHHRTFAKQVFSPERDYITVYLDDRDGLTDFWNPKLSRFDIIFRTHYNRHSKFHSECLPWVFGISNRILRETNDLPKFQERKKQLLVNFRVDQEAFETKNAWLRLDQGWLRIDQGVMIADHPLRSLIRSEFLPLIEQVLPVENAVDSFEQSPWDSYHHLHWVQTGKRHHPNYYKRLKESVACTCFAGWMAPNPTTGKTIVEWWDSWRFWESLAAGCVTFHVDLEKYGILLPVMPENWQHYIGIDFDNIQSAVDRIASDPGILERISTEGRLWAIENYGPVPTAVRFLKTLGSYGLRTNKGSESQDNSVNLKVWESVTDSVPVNLREINLIIFPDWSVPEESLCQELERTLGAIATHPDKSQITLLVDTTNISEEDANLVLSAVAMNLMMQEDLDLSQGPEIFLVTQLSERQRETLLLRLRGRIVLENENKQAIALMKAENIPAFHEVP